MKRMNILKGALCVSLATMTGVAGAQTKALNFAGASGNWAANKVGVRVAVTGPSADPTIGNKQYTISNNGSGATGEWAAPVTIPIVNTPIAMVAAGGDTVANGTLTVGSMAGKIAFIYRGTSEFGHKAVQAKLAGAVACVIVNNIPGGPIGMGAGAEGAGMATAQALPLTGLASGIPVVMISKEDGDAIDYQYRHGAAISMTITNWGNNFTNDIGFVPGGAATWHAYAIPTSQLASGSSEPYKAVDGAFIANYGATTATGVNLTTETKFTPTGGSATTLHSSTVTLGNFPVADSIYAMFDTLSTATNVYSVSATANGRFDQIYTLNTATDDYLSDNTYTNSFYTTDSLFSKGRYDFTTNKPIATQYSGRSTATDFLWGNMYFVAHGGGAISSTQYSLTKNSTVLHTLVDMASTSVYLFKWVDANTDGVVQTGELTLESTGTHNYDISSSSSNDTIGSIFTVQPYEWQAVNTTVDTDFYRFEDNTWYLVAVQIPANYFLGCDGVLSEYPRVYGHFYNKASNMLEYSNLTFDGTDATAITGADPTGNNAVMPYTQTTFIGSVDSFNFNQSKGLIPAVPFMVNKQPIHPDHPKVGVNNVTKVAIGAVLSPNPAVDYVNVTLDLDKTSATVTYTVIDGLARIVSKDVSSNVKNEVHTINTSKLPAGNYNLVIVANGTSLVKKFTIVK